MEKLFNAQVLQLGRQGENGARIIRADVSQWLEDYPNGEILLFATRPNELVPYIPADYQVADGVLTWTISNVDTGTAGNGRAELRLMDGETIVKSEVVNTEVVPCLPGTGSPVTPTPEVTDWVTRFIDSAETVDEALANADAAVAELDAAIAEAGDIVEVMQDKAPAILSTAGPADVATFTDGAAGMPMEVTVTLDPIQAGSGDPAPDNVREISGHSSVSVMAAGKNLLPGDYYNGDHYTVNGITFTVSDGKIVANGTATAAAQYNVLSRTESNWALKDGRYFLRGAPAGGASNKHELSVSITNENGSSRTLGRDYGNGVEFDYTQDMGPIGIFMIVRTGNTVTDLTFEPMLTLVDDASEEFEKPIGEQNKITFPTPPGTVYGGTLTVNKDGTGKLVVDRGYYAFDGSEGWLAFDTAENLYYLNAQSYGNFADAYTDGTESDFAISSRYVQRTYNGVLSAHNGQFAIGRPTGTSITKRIVVKDTACATVDDFKASLATNPMQVVYRIDTPVTYDLTAEQVGQITSVKGVNNVWSAGQVEVTYAADTKTYVDGVAEDVDGIQTTLADYSSVKSKANAALAGGTFTRDSSSGFPWDSGGVLGYNYTCKIPLGGTISGRAVFVSVTAAANNQLSALMNALAPFNKVDAAAGYVYLYANTNQYKPTQIKVVVI